jgi:signal transduction histidine kinase
MRWPHLKLRGQLLLSFLLLMLIPILVIGLVVHNVAEQGLTVLVTQEAQQRATAVSRAFAQYYAINGSWNGVEKLFEEFRPGPNPGQSRLPPRFQENGPAGEAPDRGPARPLPGQILITDTSGMVVASDNSRLVGQALAKEVLAHGAPLIVNNEQIGTLVIGAALGILDVQEKQLLDTVNSALLLTGLLISIAAVGLTLWLSNQLTAPVRDLMAGVKQLASGHWPEPLAIWSHNEFADLTHAFNGMAERLTRQQQQQRQMIADIAHDLRTPLSVIGLEIAGIRAGLQPPEEATESLQEEVDWLQHLIDDLHTLSLMDTGQFTLYQEDVALSPYLTSLGEQWQAMAARQDKMLVCRVPSELPVIRLDPFRMRQVFTNLLNNALQHTPRCTQITLGASIRGDQIEICVSDNGPGIAPDDVPHVFERFYRADRARNRGQHEHGSGLGLSIAYQLVMLHGGTLSVDSQPGIGATFRVRLPMSG